MGLGDRGKRRVKLDGSPTVDDLFKPTEAVQPETTEKKIGRPKGEPVKPKTFTLPLELNQRLRRFAFEHECKEVDVVRASLEAYLDTHEEK
ncbi:hypothetical protein HMPREF0326_02671 [Desulfovibrio sp. 3_1_syn3]|uniref:hypothetical protein n=1 Tax=Desulfovibrio sp. 3_1_syn3 TaxID=457398 RepID=UPI0001E12FEF|nr:hypothetical protein [Desulfovibrio sp. 3_1_syn3]EFL84809.1 hypothetical protein HMPREF0326_02671 [Desulfovibrio sp. 3_1_syn3]